MPDLRRAVKEPPSNLYKEGQNALFAQVKYQKALAKQFDDFVDWEKLWQEIGGDFGTLGLYGKGDIVPYNPLTASESANVSVLSKGGRLGCRAAGLAEAASDSVNPQRCSEGDGTDGRAAMSQRNRR